MGQVTTNTQVWTPDAGDLNEPDVYLAAMSASIENGIGERLLLQEKAIGLKASLADSSFNFTSAMQTLPFQVNAGAGDFNNGFTLAAGIATCTVAGMYIVSASIGASTGSNTGMKLQIYQNTVNVSIAEVPQHPVIWVNASGNAVVNCVPGDTIYARGACTSLPSGSTANKQTAANYLSIAMVQAVPQ